MIRVPRLPFPHIAVATIIGAMAGFYIYKPMFKKYHLERAQKELAENQVPAELNIDQGDANQERTILASTTKSENKKSWDLPNK